MAAPVGFNVPSYPGYPPVNPSGPPGYPPSTAPYPAGNVPSYPQPNMPQPPQYPQPPQQPMMMQPFSGGPVNPHVPLGLEYLTTLDKLMVSQKIELIEAFIGFETANKYSVKSVRGDKLFYCVEENDCCTRNICGPSRPFEMRMMDSNQREVIHVSRPLRCESCFFPCCLQKIEVSASGSIIGYVEQRWSILYPSFVILNEARDVVLRIEGPICTFSICGDVEFKVLSRDGQHQVGKISKQWSGFGRELFTDADYFGVSFPLDLDVKMKAVMLAACFLIDFMFFEKKGNKERDRPGMF